MDPKSQPTLDPKLQEVYDRVMGTPTAGGSTPPVPEPTPSPDTNQTAAPMSSPGVISAPAVEPQAVPPPAPADPVAAPPVPVMPDPVSSLTPPGPPEPDPTPTQLNAPSPLEPTPAPTEPAPVVPMEPVTTTPQTSSVEQVAGFNANDTKQKKGKLPVSMPILLMGIVAFFVVYALFWMKIFNVFLGS